MENKVPRIRMRTLPHPKIDEEMKLVMEDTKRFSMLIANGMEYNLNKRRLVEVRERMRERWKEKRNEMWSEMLSKIDVERNPRNF